MGLCYQRGAKTSRSIAKILPLACQLFPFRHLSFRPPRAAVSIFRTRSLVLLLTPLPHTDGFARSVVTECAACCGVESKFPCTPCCSYYICHPIPSPPLRPVPLFGLRCLTGTSASLFVSQFPSDQAPLPPPRVNRIFLYKCTHGMGKSEIPNRAKSVLVWHLRIHGVYSSHCCGLRRQSVIYHIPSSIQLNS